VPYLWVPRKKAGEGRGFVKENEYTSQKWGREEEKVLDFLVLSHTVPALQMEVFPTRTYPLKPHGMFFWC